MKFAVVIFPGSNCDRDSYYAVKSVLNEDVDYIWHRETEISGYDCVILPGGFSYGDYLRPGAIAHLSPIMKEVKAFAEKGGLVIGICNGFQVLVESGLLPGALLQNRNTHFICKHIYIKTLENNTPFTNKLDKNEVLNVPIAHMDGNYYCSEDQLKELEDNGQIIFQYSDIQGNVSDEMNPNGSVNNIAGISNKNKNVLGMMPHPERALESILGSEDGKKIFESIQSQKQ